MKETSGLARAETLSGLLLELYAGCHELPMDAFLPRALDVVRRRLPFDSAWWAMSTFDGDQHNIHASYVEGLPQNMHALWLSIQDEDVIGHAVLQHPGRTLNFTPAEVDRTKGSRWLARTTGFRHVLCTVNVNPIIGQQHFLALSRHDESKGFSEDERQFKELLMPHLNATLDVNRLLELRRLHAQGHAQRHPMAVIDRLGAIHHAEPTFIEDLKRQWPRWWGPRVPDPVLQALAGGGDSYAGSEFMVRWSWIADLALVEVSPHSPLDQLSQREREVALRYAAGGSYKEVAQDLGMAPATVRHHLRTVYEKVGVTNKATLIQAIGASR
jgi:DNA-binding CsgD family transcriptional regulator